MRNINTLIEWLKNSKNKHWIALIIVIFFGVLMRVLGGSFVSPFISIPEQTASELNQWAFDCFSPEKKQCYFIIDALFGLSLAFLHYYLYHQWKVKNDNEGDVSIEKSSKTPALFVLFVLLALITDWLEGLCFLTSPLSCTYEIQCAKLLFYSLVWVFLLYLSIRTFISWIDRNKDSIHFL